MKNSNHMLIGWAISRSGMFGRIVGYTLYYIPLTLIWFLVLLLGLPKEGLFATELLNFVFLVALLAIVPALPFVLWEWRVRSWRKKNNLPVNKNIAKELAQMNVDQDVMMKQEALEKAIGSSAIVDKTDLGYWHALLQIGAITSDEYEAKKKELL